jgi:hypothetical protein
MPAAASGVNSTVDIVEKLSQSPFAAAGAAGLTLGGSKMARIKIEDLPEDRELTEAELDRVAGGILIGLNLALAPSLERYGSYSISKLPLPGGGTGGISVMGVRG